MLSTLESYISMHNLENWFMLHKHQYSKFKKKKNTDKTRLQLCSFARRSVS